MPVNSWGKPIIESLKKRGYIWDAENNTFEPPNSIRALFLIQNGINVPKKNKSRSYRIKTGWIDDTLNIKNKEKQIDNFIRLAHMETGLSVWPEFYFLIDKQYRFDYCIPIHTDGRILKIAIECDGGTHMRGLSGHSSPEGIQRDMDKGTLAAVHGWTLIRRTPQMLCTSETINLIMKSIDNLK